MALIDELIKENWLRTPRIIEAFQEIKRVDFLPEDIKDLAELNEALPIGNGQTISQPLTVAFMLELLQPEPGQKILDIGSGSGWTSALLAHIASSKIYAEKKSKQNFDTTEYRSFVGKVVAVEIVPELMEFGRKNVAKYNFLAKGVVEFISVDGSKGYRKEAPYDKILCSAAVQKNVPFAWKEQLKIGGRIVTPIANSIWLFVKNPPAGGRKEFEETEYPGFAFVPLVSQ